MKQDKNRAPVLGVWTHSKSEMTFMRHFHTCLRVNHFSWITAGYLFKYKISLKFEKEKLWRKVRVAPRAPLDEKTKESASHQLLTIKDMRRELPCIIWCCLRFDLRSTTRKKHCKIRRIQVTSQKRWKATSRSGCLNSLQNWKYCHETLQYISSDESFLVNYRGISI